jgi:DNA-binding NarL/FixJ family response regulator
MSPLIRVGIVGAHPLFRGGLVDTLRGTNDCQVVAEGAGRAEAVRIAVECSPDVMLLDLHSELSIALVRRLGSQFRFMRTIILRWIGSEDEMVALLQAGAAGYMLKGVGGPELVESVRRVHRGECYVSQLAAKLVVNRRPQILDRSPATAACDFNPVLRFLSKAIGAVRNYGNGDRSLPS